MDYAETDVNVRVRRVDPVAVRRPAVPGVDVPAAATNNPDRARSWASGIIKNIT